MSDAISRSKFKHLEGRVPSLGTVVNSWENVAVDIDHFAIFYSTVA